MHFPFWITFFTLRFHNTSRRPRCSCYICGLSCSILREGNPAGKNKVPLSYIGIACERPCHFVPRSYMVGLQPHKPENSQLLFWLHYMQVYSCLIGFSFFFIREIEQSLSGSVWNWEYIIAIKCVWLPQEAKGSHSQQRPTDIWAWTVLQGASFCGYKVEGSVQRCVLSCCFSSTQRWPRLMHHIYALRLFPKLSLQEAGILLLWIWWPLWWGWL